ncbi:glycosyltransferase [bacterium]|nr:glycosyltransferase [bacterium]
MTVVLVSWNSLENTVDLVSGIRTFTRMPYELVVVDNASTDGTLSFLRDLKGERCFRLVENASNFQCARATNQALALASGEYVAYLCASHALVTEPGWDEALVRFLDEHSDVALAGDLWDPYGFLLPSRRYVSIR